MCTFSFEMIYLQLLVSYLVIFLICIIEVECSKWEVVSKSTIDIKPGAGVVEATQEAVSYKSNIFYCKMYAFFILFSLPLQNNL